MMKTFTRRTLIQTAISGTAAVSMPGLASAMISNAGPDAASNVESDQTIGFALVLPEDRAG
jgi:hypothetical protein